MSSIISALIGGGILGLAVVGYLYVNGRITGISGYCLNYYNPSYWFEAQLCGSYWGY
jgi:hypothetical protein